MQPNRSRRRVPPVNAREWSRQPRGEVCFSSEKKVQPNWSRREGPPADLAESPFPASPDC
jgi:hypothetical protein